MSKAIPVYMPKFEPSKPSASTTHYKKRSSQTALQNPKADPLNLKMKPVAEIGDDSSYVCTTTTEEGRKETVMQTEGNSYIGVAINQEALDCSFDTGHNFYHDTEAKGNLKKKSKIKGPLMTLNSPTREERNLSSPLNMLINPFTTTTGTLETEARVIENNEEMIQSEGHLQEEGKKRFKFSFSVSNRLCFFLYLTFAVSISVGSVCLSTSSINLIDSPYLTNGLIALVTVGLSNYLFQKSIFMKKRPKIFNLMAQNPLNLSIYYFPPSYYVYRGLNIVSVLCSGLIFTNFLLKFTLYERAAILVAISAGISLISQLLFALYYMKVYKPNLKNLKPKTFLNIPGVKNNKYNEFMDDLKNVKAHIATLKTEKDSEETPPTTDKYPESTTTGRDKESPIPGDDNLIKHLPSMSKRHILCGNLIFFSFVTSLMINLMVPLTISKAFNSAKLPTSGITLWGLVSGPMIYVGLSGLTSIVFKRLKFQADFLVDVLLFLGIIGSYKAIFLVYPSRQSNTLTDLIMFAGGKMLWKYLVYLYQMYKLSPSDESQGKEAVYKKKQTETGEVVELFKRSHINFGMKIWFWQYSDIVLSIAYLVLLPLINLKSFNQLSHVRHYKTILNPIMTLIGEVILEIGGLFLMRYLFIRSNPVVRRVNFVSNLQNYSKQNLAILMLACIFVVFLSINILDITISFV